MDITVCDVAALLTVASRCHPEYGPGSFNCYWFVAVVVAAIEAAYDGCMTFGTTGTSAGHLRMIPIVSAVDIERDMAVVVPDWVKQKTVYQAMKTTEEVSLGFSYFSGPRLTTVVPRTNERLKRDSNEGLKRGDKRLKRGDERLKRRNESLKRSANNHLKPTKM